MTSRYYFGRWIDEESPLNRDQVNQLCDEADQRRVALQNYSTEKILQLFDRMGKKWSDPCYPLRKELMDQLPAQTGFSKEMIKLGMEELVATLDSNLLRRKIVHELNGLTASDLGLYQWNSRTRLKWNPLGVILHILSGNVFLVGLGSLVEGLLTGNITLLKMSSGETLFLPRLLKSLVECDEDGVVSRSVALIDYRATQKDVIETFKKRVDGVVVWGGEQAVRAYREDLPARTKLIVFGPKLSLAIVTEAGLKKEGDENVASKLADDVCIWDQNACTAPQLCYVQGRANALQLAELLANKMETRQQSLPAGDVDRQAAVEIQKIRGVSEIAEARGKGLVRQSTGNVDWTVVVDEKTEITPSPLHRTIRLIPFDCPKTVLHEISQLRGYIQTVGLACSDRNHSQWFDKLASVGALRVMALGQMATAEIEDPHDGSYDLPQYGHFVYERTPSNNL